MLKFSDKDFAYLFLVLFSRHFSYSFLTCCCVPLQFVFINEDEETAAAVENDEEEKAEITLVILI